MSAERQRRGCALAGALVLLGACATDAVGPVEPPAEASTSTVVEVDPVPEPDLPVPAPEPVARTVAATGLEEAEGSGLVGAGAGTLRAGELTLDLPAGALSDGVSVTMKLYADPTRIERDVQFGGAVGGGHLEPWDPGFTRAVTLTIPLWERVEPGAQLELLGWQPAMLSWLVIGVGTASSDGASATFTVRQLGEVVVRHRPESDPEGALRCPGVNVALRRSLPPAGEDETVGLVDPAARVPRDAAFSVLSDFRLSSLLASVDFKNEEVRENHGTHRRETAHIDEDFLMDPNVAAATAALARLVEQEWRDPLTGEPAFRLRITEAYDALIEHSQRSSHYQGRAADLTLSPVPAANGEERRAMYGRLARLASCAGFDWSLFENEFHVHASVVPTRVALVLENPEGDRVVATAPLHDLRQIRERAGVVVPPGAWSDFVWSAHGTFEFPGAAPARAPDFAALDGRPRDAALSVDGLRRLAIYDGRAWIVSSAGPPPGCTSDCEAPVDVRHPLPVPLPPGQVEARVIDAAFLLHRPTAEAFRRFVRLP